MCPSAKPHASVNQDNNEHLRSEEEENDNDLDQIEEEEDPYNLCPEDIYDTVDGDGTYNPAILNRPPAPIPRPESESDPEQPMPYISRGNERSFSLSPKMFRFHKTVLHA